MNPFMNIECWDPGASGVENGHDGIQPVTDVDNQPFNSLSSIHWTNTHYSYYSLATHHLTLTTQPHPTTAQRTLVSNL